MDQHPKSRRRHSAEFKSQVVQACSAPGASTAAVALSFGVNANLVRQWRSGRGFRRAGDEVTQPAGTTPVTAATIPSFVALASPAAQPQAASGDEIRIDVRRGPLEVKVSWPSTAAAECVAWLRELLQ